MTLHIMGDVMWSDVTDATAVRPGLAGWEVTGHPARLTRNQAITVMTIAEERSKPQPDEALIGALERELAES